MIAARAHAILGSLREWIVECTEYERRMAPYSEVDNGPLMDCLGELTHKLTQVGAMTEHAKLYAIKCETEARLREQEDQQKDEDADGERPE